MFASLNSRLSPKVQPHTFLCKIGVPVLQSCSLFLKNCKIGHCHEFNTNVNIIFLSYKYHYFRFANTIFSDCKLFLICKIPLFLIANTIISDLQIPLLKIPLFLIYKFIISYWQMLLFPIYKYHYFTLAKILINTIGSAYKISMYACKW